MFRLTQDEYNSLRKVCAEKGGRNFSEFTRSELLTLADSRSLSEIIQTRFAEIERRIAGMQVSLERLSRLLSRAGRQED